ESWMRGIGDVMECGGHATAAFLRDGHAVARPRHGRGRFERRHGRRTPDASDAASEAWWDAAMLLLAASDEASTGAGFAFVGTRVAFLIWQAYLAAKSNLEEVLPYVPHSLCVEVPPQQACVQPKTRKDSQVVGTAQPEGCGVFR
ncbi:MAG TPA: hypothetical protein VII75_08320, partial [Thermoanaerobaculia bacterium]